MRCSRQSQCRVRTATCRGVLQIWGVRIRVTPGVEGPRALFPRMRPTPSRIPLTLSRALTWAPWLSSCLRTSRCPPRQAQNTGVLSSYKIKVSMHGRARVRDRAPAVRMGPPCFSPSLERPQRHLPPAACSPAGRDPSDRPSARLCGAAVGGDGQESTAAPCRPFLGPIPSTMFPEHASAPSLLAPRAPPFPTQEAPQVRAAE